MKNSFLIYKRKLCSSSLLNKLNNNNLYNIKLNNTLLSYSQRKLHSSVFSKNKIFHNKVNKNDKYFSKEFCTISSINTITNVEINNTDENIDYKNYIDIKIESNEISSLIIDNEYYAIDEIKGDDLNICDSGISKIVIIANKEEVRNKKAYILAFYLNKENIDKKEVHLFQTTLENKISSTTNIEEIILNQLAVNKIIKDNTNSTNSNSTNNTISTDNTDATDNTNQNCIPLSTTPKLNITLINSSLKAINKISDINLTLNLNNSEFNSLSKISKTKIEINSSNSEIKINHLDDNEIDLTSYQDKIDLKLYDINNNSVIKANNSCLKEFKISFWSAFKFNIFFSQKDKFEKLIFLDREGYSFCPNLILDINNDEVFNHNDKKDDNLEEDSTNKGMLKKKDYLFYNSFKSFKDNNNEKMIKLSIGVLKEIEILALKSNKIAAYNIIYELNNDLNLIKYSNKYFFKRTKIILLSFISLFIFINYILLIEYDNDYNTLHTYFKLSQIHLYQALLTNAHANNNVNDNIA